MKMAAEAKTQAEVARTIVRRDTGLRRVTVVTTGVIHNSPAEALWSIVLSMAMVAESAGSTVG